MPDLGKVFAKEVVQLIQARVVNVPQVLAMPLSQPPPAM